MYIHEALAAIDNDRPYITRERWQKPDSWGPNFPRMLATNPRVGLAIKSVHHPVPSPRFGWVPTVQDLVADDWIAVS